MPTSAAPEYVLGTHEPELHRLALQHQFWSRQAHALWERARVGPGSVVLDLGCGPGYAALDLAQLVGPTGRIVGVDQAPHFVEFFNQQAAARGLTHAVAHAGDVAAALRLAGAQPGSFDAVYARWVFCFLPNVEEVVATAAAALKPGGVFLVQDYFNYQHMTMAPRSAAFSRIIDATVAAWTSRGGDPDVMGTLPTIAAGHGLTIEHIGVHQRLARPGDPLWQWPVTFWRNFIPILLEMKLTNADEADAFWRAFEQMERRPEQGGCMVLPPVFEVMARKP